MSHRFARPTRRAVVGGGLTALAAAGLPRRARAGGPITIKVATVAPEGTSWAKGISRIGQEWARISNGEVRLKLYAGGVAGHEGTAVRKMRIGQLHMAALTNVGLLDIDPAPQVINTPLLIRSNAQLDCVMPRLTPTFEKRLLDKGFVVLNWSDVGWVRFFTRGPMRTPEDAAKYKFWIWDGDPGALLIYREAGFNPVVTASIDIIPSLQSGLLDGFPATPLSALAMQWFALAPHMLDLAWAPLTGATVITRAAWDAIPASYHEAFLDAARRIGDELRAEIRAQDGKAIAVMKKYGLQVTEVDAATRKAWEERALRVRPIIREKIVPPDVFDAATAAAEACG